MKKSFLWIILFVVMVSGCASQSECLDDDSSSKGINYSVLEPIASGDVVYQFDLTTIDASHMQDGYVMIKNDGSDRRMKVRFIHEDQMYTYEVSTNGTYDVYPLQMGNGLYEVRLYENTSGSSYVVSGDLFLDISLDNPQTVFLYPNQYVWYTNYDQTVAISYQLCEGLQTDREKLDVIYDYVVSHMKYDDEKASTIKNGYLPDVDAVLQLGKGICFDYAAIMGAMLRAQDIPCRLVAGEVEPEYVYHAWNQVLIDEKWVTVDATFNNNHKEASYTESKRY